jgi:hypothetical protein
LEAFQGDIKDFWNWLIDNEGLPSSQYLLSKYQNISYRRCHTNDEFAIAYQFGIEPFSGSGGNFDVTWFTAAVN